MSLPKRTSQRGMRRASLAVLLAASTLLGAAGPALPALGAGLQGAFSISPREAPAAFPEASLAGQTGPPPPPGPRRLAPPRGFRRHLAPPQHHREPGRDRERGLQRDVEPRAVVRRGPRLGHGRARPCRAGGRLHPRIEHVARRVACRAPAAGAGLLRLAFRARLRLPPVR